MDWSSVLGAKVQDVEKEEVLLEDLYSFFINESLPLTAEEAPRELQDQNSLLKVLQVLRAVMKVKGLEVMAAEEEMRDLQDQCDALAARVGGDTSEKGLVEENVRLEKELRYKNDMIERLKDEQATQSISSSKMLEVRHLRDELEDVKLEREELKRSLHQEREENKKLLERETEGKLRYRQLERELEAVKHNLEENTKTLEWHRGMEHSKGKEADFRERMRKKTSEMESLEDMVQELLRKRDEQEDAMRQMLEELVEERELKLAAINDKVAMEKALVKSDSHCDELEAQISLLSDQVQELQQQLSLKAAENEEAFSILSRKAPEWEHALEQKDKELAKCREKIQQLEGQLQSSQGHVAHTSTMKGLKKELEKREAELVAMQSELGEATQHISDLAAELEQVRGRGDPALVKSAMKQELDRAQAKVAMLEKDLALEVHRREEAEAENEGRDEKMTLALGKLGEYERGDYGLREAVMEIKVKKKELALRDKDISELTQHVNQLENELNKFGEENEALRERLGIGESEEVDVSQVREKRRQQLLQLQKDSRMLEKEVERLKEENVSLRRKNLEYALVKTTPTSTPAHVTSKSEGSTSHDPSDSSRRRGGSSTSLMPGGDMKSKVMALEKACEEERHNRELWQAKAQETMEKLKQNQFRLRSVEAVLKEMHKQGDSSEVDKSKSDQESLDRLLVLLQSEGGQDTVHLKSKLSELTGQNEVLTQQLHRAEHDTKAAIRELERKQCEVEALTKEVLNLRKQVAGFRPIPLPEGLPLSSSEVITSLNEQLLHALQQLHEREEELRKVRGSVDGLQRKFGVIMHQLGILYQEYMDKCKQWEDLKKTVDTEKQKLLEEKALDKIKVQELESLQATLAGGEEEMKKMLGEMSRRVTVLQVKEQVTGRKAQLLQEREKTLRKENAALCREKVQIEKAVTERLAFLQRHKETSLYKLHSLQQELSHCVHSSELDKANAQYQQLATKYQHLLNQQNAYTATATNVEQLKVEIRTLNGQLDEVKTELSVEKNKCRLLEETADVAGDNRRKDGVGARDKGASADQVATLEMKALNATQRAELASVRYQQLQEVVMQLEQRNSTLEANFAELTQRLLQTQANEAELQDQVASALPQEQRVEMEQRISELSKSEAQLNISNSQLKEVAEVARQQATAMETMQKSRDLEVMSLRHQILDLQGQSDEKTALGRLHHQLLSCQASEVTAKKKLEAVEAQVIKLEAALLRSERERVRESEAVFKARAEANTKIKHLRSTIQSLRRQYAGCVPLSEHENFIILLQRAQEDKREAEKLRKESKKDREEAKDKLLELGVQRKNLEELISALQDISSNPNSASASTRMVEWHSKLGELRLVEMRVTRANQRLRERVTQLEGLVGCGEEAFSELEQQLVAVRKEYEEKQLLWEQREVQLERQLEEIKASAPVTSLDIPASANHNSPRQLQDALMRLQECSRDKNMLSQHLQTKQREVERLEQALRQLKDELVQKEDETTLVRRDMEKMRKTNLLTMAEREEEERALKLSQETTKQLKIQLSEKEEVAEKYQSMLQDARKELQREVTAHKQEIAALRTKLHSQEEQNFTKLKSEALEAASSPAPIVPSDNQLERLLVLEDMTASQEEEIKQLRDLMESEEEESRARMKEYEVIVKNLQNEAKEKNKQHQIEVEELRDSLSEKKVRVDELEQEIEVLEGELSAAQEAAKKAPSRTLRALVDRLRNQLSIKEKQQRALSEALLQVRADLVETAQRTLEGEDKRAAQEESIRELVLHKTEQLQEQIEELKQQLNEVEGERSASENREKESLEKIKKLNGEIRSKEREVREARLQLQEQAEALTRSKSNEDLLTKRIQQLEREPSVFVLQRRVKTLQEKVESQKSKIKELEGELQARIVREQKLMSQGQGLKQRSRDLIPTDTGEKSTMAAQTDMSGKVQSDDRTHQAMQVLRWEEGKKWQKKMASVRVKLEEKTRESEAAQKQITGLKELQARSDRERLTLSAKIKTLQKQLSESQEKSEEGSGGAGSHSVIELERVINAMRKVIDKLQGENEKLKKKKTDTGLSTSSKTNEKILEENRKLKADLLELQRSSPETRSDSSPYKKLVSENERLKKELKAETSRSETLQKSLSNTQLQNQRLTQEVRFSHSSPSLSSDGRLRDAELTVKVEELQAELEKKTTMLMEVKRHLRGAAEKEKSNHTALIQERDELKEETVKLRKELDAFDPAFFEEIEDLKFNYQEAVKKNVRLEAQLSRLTEHQIQDGDS